MQYELRTKVIEPTRKTFDNLVARYGDRPASRYEEGSIDIQAKENFHFRPLWAPDKEIYDETFSVLRLTDPYSFTDPRQYYYAPYVTSRASMADAVNCFFIRDLRAPFGGVGSSGIGREGGNFSREFFTEPKAVIMQIDTA